jgi:hypothetical protein
VVADFLQTVSEDDRALSLRLQRKMCIVEPCWYLTVGACMDKHFAVIRDGKEVIRVDADHYTQDSVVPPRITFRDVDGGVVRTIAPEVGDVVRPVVVGFYNPYPPIDQSSARINELTARMHRLEAAERA